MTAQQNFKISETKNQKIGSEKSKNWKMKRTFLTETCQQKGRKQEAKNQKPDRENAKNLQPSFIFLSWKSHKIGASEVHLHFRTDAKISENWPSNLRK